MYACVQKISNKQETPRANTKARNNEENETKQEIHLICRLKPRRSTRQWKYESKKTWQARFTEGKGSKGGEGPFKTRVLQSFSPSGNRERGAKRGVVAETKLPKSTWKSCKVFGFGSCWWLVVFLLLVSYYRRLAVVLILAVGLFLDSGTLKPPGLCKQTDTKQASSCLPGRQCF